MALRKDYQLPNTSIVITDAYCRVKALRFDHPDRAYIQVGVYEAGGDGAVIDTIDYELTMEELGSKDAIHLASCYAWLKTQVEWADATDIVEE